ncbi:MAG: hypothetical protein ACXQS6_05970 [Candidatus Syntropharchaeales archaeon]
MKIEKTWTASSKSEEIEKGEELVNMAGQWGVGIEVRITRPLAYSQGPVERKIRSEETHDGICLPLPNTP